MEDGRIRSNSNKTRFNLMKITKLLGYSAPFPHTAYILNKGFRKPFNEVPLKTFPEALPEALPGGPPEV